MREILKKAIRQEGCDISPEAEVLIQQLAECLTGEDDITGVMTWLEEKSRNYPVTVEEMGINALDKWEVDSSTGNIHHESGKFFSIIGVKISGAAGREVSSWTQPMMKQNECGILGILCQNRKGIRQYLLYAKFEPGNSPLVQLSPTLQATASNLKQVHGGKKPRFAEYFEEGGKGKVLVDVEGVEDGGRFYHKTNRNMVVEVDEQETLDVPEDYIWLTMAQIKKLVRQERAVNSLTRSVLGSF